MNTAILIDFGSTFTKSAVVSLDSGELIFKAKTPSTVKNDARIGLEICLEEIKNYIGSDNLLKSLRFASSSAAGGLRMVVIGLTPSLSMMAGKNAAYGAGAKVIKAFSYKLTDNDLEEIIKINPEIILSNVLFPQPEGPSMLTKAPASALKLISSNTFIS